MHNPIVKFIYRLVNLRLLVTLALGLATLPLVCLGQDFGDSARSSTYGNRSGSSSSIERQGKVAAETPNSSVAVSQRPPATHTLKTPPLTTRGIGAPPYPTSPTNTAPNGLSASRGVPSINNP
jgi:hypothetical protein